MKREDYYYGGITGYDQYDDGVYRDTCEVYAGRAMVADNTDVLNVFIKETSDYDIENYMRINPYLEPEKTMKKDTPVKYRNSTRENGDRIVAVVPKGMREYIRSIAAKENKTLGLYIWEAVQEKMLYESMFA